MEEGLKTTRALQRAGRSLSASIPKSIFLLLYLGGSALLLLGLTLSVQGCWTLVHQQGSLWLICVTTMEIFVLAAALTAILVIPRIQHQDSDQDVLNRKERRSWTIRKWPVSE